MHTNISEQAVKPWNMGMSPVEYLYVMQDPNMYVTVCLYHPVSMYDIGHDISMYRFLANPVNRQQLQRMLPWT
jgi:hypothetical protein